MSWTGLGEGRLDPMRAQIMPPHITWTRTSSSHPLIQTLAQTGLFPGFGPILDPLWGDLGLVELNQAPQTLRIPSPPTASLGQALALNKSLKLGRETGHPGYCCYL